MSWLESRVNRRLEGPQDEFLTKKLSKLNDDYILSPGSSDSLVVFFTSSVNEFASTPEFMDNIPCSQSAIKELAKAFPSTRFVVRVHPNSSEHDTFEFNSLTTFDQIEVIHLPLQLIVIVLLRKLLSSLFLLQLSE